MSYIGKTPTNVPLSSSDLDDGIITTAKIANVNVTTAKILDNNITLAKLALGTDGNLISYDANGNPVAIAAGSSGQILTSAGAGAVPSFQDTGPSGDVTTNGVQTLTNKTLTSPKITSIVTISNADIELAPNGTGHVTIKGNNNDGTLQLNCTANSHGQQIKSQPHSASVTNTMLLPAGANSTLVSLVSTDTLTNKTLTSPKINEDVAVTSTATELNILDGVTSTTAELNILDGGTATASELNSLDGVTSTAAELN